MDIPENVRTVRLVQWHDRDIPRTDRGVRRALRALGEEEILDRLPEEDAAFP